MTNKKLSTVLEKHKTALSAQRDRLRDTLADLEALEEVLTRAIDALEEAISALSEQV